MAHCAAYGDKPGRKMWIWGLQMLANCTHAAYARNKGRMVRLADYSDAQMPALRALPGLAFDGREQGTLQLFRQQKQLDHAGDDIAVLLFTSGTTGVPKAAVLRQKHLVSSILGSVEFGGAGEDEEEA